MEESLTCSFSEMLSRIDEAQKRLTAMNDELVKVQTAASTFCISARDSLEKVMKMINQPKTFCPIKARKRIDEVRCFADRLESVFFEQEFLVSKKKLQEEKKIQDELKTVLRKIDNQKERDKEISRQKEILENLTPGRVYPLGEIALALGVSYAVVQRKCADLKSSRTDGGQLGVLGVHLNEYARRMK